MDVNYLLKIYIQIHFLKTIFLSKKTSSIVRYNISFGENKCKFKI